MKVFYENSWCIERDDGTMIRLTWNESSALRNAMQRAWIWDEVCCRFEDHPQWNDIEDCKDDIIDEMCEDLFYEDDTVISYAVWHSVEKWVDLEDNDDDV